MPLANVFNALWYKRAGLGVPRVKLEVFAPALNHVLELMVPVHEIISSASIDLGREWEPDLEQDMIFACVAHLSVWQEAHNAMNSLRPDGPYETIHRKGMTASRAYGETLAAYVEYRDMFLSPQFLSQPYFRKQEDGKQWDALAREHAQSLIDELHRLSARNPIAFKLLLPSSKVPDILEDIGTDRPGFPPSPLQHFVAPFD